MSECLNYLDEAMQWAHRAARNDHRADGYLGHCRRTMLALGDYAEAMAGRAALRAARENDLQRAETEAMQQPKSGLHPYRAAVFFILREKRDGHWPGPKSNDAVQAGDVGRVSGWYVVRCIAEAFGKTNREVARDLIDTYRALEDGQPAP